MDIIWAMATTTDTDMVTTDTMDTATTDTLTTMDTTATILARGPLMPSPLPRLLLMLGTMDTMATTMDTMDTVTMDTTMATITHTPTTDTTAIIINLFLGYRIKS